MDENRIFAILGIPSTKEEEKIKNAYRQRLRLVNPEDDPEGFKQLRQAYEEALVYAKQQETEEKECDSTPSGLFVQKADASTIGVLGQAVQKLFGDTGVRIIGSRHGEKLYETLMTREELVRAEDMGDYFRVTPDGRDLNYDNYVKYDSTAHARVQMDEDYSSHNTTLLDVEGTVRKILTTEYVQNEYSAYKK